MLDFYKITDVNRNDVLHSISENVLLKINDDLINRGLNIDLYGTIRLYPSHISIIIDILQKRNMSKSDLFKFLLEVKNRGEVLILEGN